MFCVTRQLSNLFVVSLEHVFEVVLVIRAMQFVWITRAFSMTALSHGRIAAATLFEWCDGTQVRLTGVCIRGTVKRLWWVDQVAGDGLQRLSMRAVIILGLETLSFKMPICSIASDSILSSRR